LLGQNFDAPPLPALILSTKSRIWGDPSGSAQDPSAPEFAAQNLRQKTLVRDAYRCRYCGFQAESNAVHNLNDNHSDLSEDNLQTADQLCHGWHHLGELGAEDAVIAYLPGLSGQDINHLQRTLMVALQSDDEDARADAKALLNWAASHRDYAKLAWGTHAPATFADAVARLSGAARDARETVFADLALIYHPALFGDIARGWASAEYRAYPATRWSQVHHDVMNAPI
jgi:hypothetical protein